MSLGRKAEDRFSHDAPKIILMLLSSHSNALADMTAMSDWITSEICDSIFRDILSETRRHEQRRL